MCVCFCVGWGGVGGTIFFGSCRWEVNYLVFTFIGCGTGHILDIVRLFCCLPDDDVLED